MNYYNENDPKAAAWLRELIKAGEIPDGHVDTRSINEVRPHELTKYDQQHFFAGLGGWSLALRLAGWPDTKPVRTGSCPCQPFSQTGKQLGVKDARHLWPNFRDLITFGDPTITFGEQVASPLGRDWLAGVRTDMEGLGYEVGAADLCAAGLGAPHIRQRIYWVANRKSQRRDRSTGMQRQNRRPIIKTNGPLGGLADPNNSLGRPTESGRNNGHRCPSGRKEGSSDTGCGGIADRSGWQGRNERIFQCEHQWPPGTPNLVVCCEDGKARRFEPGSFPLADGIPGRVGLLRGYGNAIVPQLAAEFIQAACEAIETLKP